jgi:serine/threonine protein kinase/Tol biopolymer transport system component
MTGRTLAHYQVTEKLGAGGMGEVYLARDARLAREVAIKVLPAAFAGDQERLLRFEREAQVLASLNHPNIAAIYGIEQSDDGVRFLAMEYVPGDTLRGPIAIDDLLPIIRQIIDALEEAHERGIVHRDLKPANIKVTPDGKVKVLDFGLAKALADEPGSQAGSANSPTLAATAYTRAGVLLGTAAYMSPEQARGKPVDKRTDIFAFGAVLYELLTGSQAFGGETMSDSLAAILTRDLDLARLPASTPPNLRKLLARCLEKDPKKRLRDIGEARVILDEAPAGLVEAAPVPAPARKLAWLPWALVAITAIGSGLAMWKLRAPSAPPRGVVHISTAAPDFRVAPSLLAMSRDGSRVAYSTGSPGSPGPIHVRMLDHLVSRPIPGTEGGNTPFFSPDGQWIGFLQKQEYRKVQVAGGATLRVADARGNFGATWGVDGTIVFGANTLGLSRVSAAGGAVTEITKPDPKKGETAHRWPEFTPDGKHVIFTIGTGADYDSARLAMLSLETRTYRALLEGGAFGRVLPTGPIDGKTGDSQLVYWNGGSLFAVPFDSRRGEVAGSAIPVLEGVYGVVAMGATFFAASHTGDLVYLPGGRTEIEMELVMFDERGTQLPLAAPKRYYQDLRLSPDGGKVAVSTSSGGKSDIWVVDLARGTATRLTFQGDCLSPIWTPDGRSITFRTREYSILSVPADGSAPPEKLLELSQPIVPTSWSPDGSTLAYVRGDQTSGDIMFWMRKETAPQPFLATPFSERGATFSPDGKWIAYMSNESGVPQVYVRPASGSGGKWQVSAEAGNYPRWVRGGRGLIYRRGPSVYAVDVEAGATFRAGAPRLLYSGPEGPTAIYDVSADGRRFLFAKPPAEERSATPQLHFIFNWFEDIRRRVRAGG